MRRHLVQPLKNKKQNNPYLNLYLSLLSILLILPMKQTAAILLMLLLVFNITGYRFTVQWMQQNQNAGLQKQLDAADYDEASLIEISVPLSLPYYNNWPEFERFDGEIMINGIAHKYVMRKVQDGKLIVKCLPNPQQQVIQKM